MYNKQRWHLKHIGWRDYKGTPIKFVFVPDAGLFSAANTKRPPGQSR